MSETVLGERTGTGGTPLQVEHRLLSCCVGFVSDPFAATQRQLQTQRRTVKTMLQGLIASAVDRSHVLVVSTWFLRIHHRSFELWLTDLWLGRVCALGETE